MSKRQLGAAKTNEQGMALVYVMLMLPLLSVITVGIMLSVAAGTTGVRDIQAVKTFAVADAGMHYALAKLQVAGAVSYGSGGPESVAIADGSTTIGTASVGVQCLHPAGFLPPANGSGCPDNLATSSINESAFRKIVSVGSLPVSGSSRTFIAFVQGSVTTGTPSLCTYSSLLAEQNVTIYGDIGSNGTIDLQGTGSNASQVRNDPAPPYTNGGVYTGSATAQSNINCSAGCATQVMGTTTPNNPSTVCPSETLPAMTPGSQDKSVGTTGWTMDSTTGYNWRNISVSGSGSSSSCTFADLRIQTGAAGTTTVVTINRLNMGTCGRLMLLGDGNVELRVANPSAEGVELGNYARFGVLSYDTYASPAPVSSGRLKVYVKSNAASTGASAFDFDNADIVAGTFIIPDGGFDSDQTMSTRPMKIYGSIQAKSITLAPYSTVTFDTTALGGSIWGNFKKFRSWKDQ